MADAKLENDDKRLIDSVMRTEEGKPDKTQLEFMTKLRADVETDDQNMEPWRLKQIISVNQRLGLKRVTDEPYPGAPDIPLPETDKLIKKSLPGKVLSAWSPKKKAVVKLADGEQVSDELVKKVRLAEKKLNSDLKSPRVGLFKKLMMMADNVEQYGFWIARVFQDFQTRIDSHTLDLDRDFNEQEIEEFRQLGKADKVLALSQRFQLDPEDTKEKETIDRLITEFNSGARVTKYNKEVIQSFTNIKVELPTKITVPGFTTDMDSAYRVKREEQWTRVELENMMDSGVFIKHDLDNLKFTPNGGTDSATDSLNEHQKARNEGIIDQDTDTGTYNLEIINAWHRPEKDAPWQRWIFVFFANVGSAEDALLQSIPFPYPIDGSDYVKHNNEIKDPRFFDSRGTPEQIRAYQDIMERAIKNKLIRDEMINTPMYEVQDNSEIMDAHINFRPGQKLPVQQIGTEIQLVGPVNSVDMESERIISMVKGFVEEYKSSNDQLFRNSTNAGGGKTKGEIGMGIQQNSAPLQLDITSWNESLSRLYHKFYEVMKDRMVESVFIDGEEIKPSDMDFPAVVASNGSIEMSEQSQAVNQAMNRVQMVTNFMQAGIATSEDLWNAATEWLERDGSRDPEQFITDPKIIMQEQITQMAQQLQQMQQQAEMLQEANISATKEIARTKKADIKGKIMNVAEAEETIKSAQAKAANNDLKRNLEDGS